MKRIALAAASALVLVGAMAMPAAAQVYDRYGYSGGYDQRDYDGYGYNDRGYDNRGWDRNGYADGYRDGYRASNRYDRHYGWRRGGYVRDYYGRTAIVDYRREHLRAPPRGYHYVRNDRGDVVLAAIATGLIVGLIAGSY